MISSHNQQIIKFFSNATKRFSKKNTLNKEDLKYLFQVSVNLLSINYPNEYLIGYYIFPDLIKSLLIELYNIQIKTIDTNKTSQTEFSELIKKIPKVQEERYIRFRVFEKEGYYPDCDLIRNNIHYSNINQFPTLTTSNKYSSEYKFGFSELPWITRKELQVATCILLAPESGIPLLFFTDYNFIDINEEILKKVPKILRLHFLFELLQFQNRFKTITGHYIEREPLRDISTFRFVKFKTDKIVFNKLFDTYSIRNHLLMRTSNHLIKSGLLWRNRYFGEEAVSNVLFGVEGCLHLLQRKFGEQKTQLNLNLIRKIFVDNFTNGENLFDFIQEGYLKRISIVHPEPNWGANWTPFIMADDFYDYFNLVRELMNYILIDRKIEY